MTRFLIGLAVVVGTSAAGVVLMSSPAAAQQARNLAEFCGVWNAVCNRTCPSGAGNCKAECATRASACRSSGCFHFNRPGPRCFNDPRARELTDPKYAPNPQRAREQRQKAQATDSR